MRVAAAVAARNVLEVLEIEDCVDQSFAFRSAEKRAIRSLGLGDLVSRHPFPVVRAPPQRAR
jgi:hypothetical protein